MFLVLILTGCTGMWDIIACWPSAAVGEVVTISCPHYFHYFNDQHKGNLSKNCTSNGWTEIHPANIALNCGYNVNSSADEGKFFWTVKVGYTIGHSVSLISVTTATVTLCAFRKLHCTRNYIHVHLFVSFILKAIAVFIKDVVLYGVSESENCSSRSVACKVVIVFFQYCVMTSYFWLLLEGLYLHTLLAISFFSGRKYFWWYILIGWGRFPPSTWFCSRCWDIIEISDPFWWIIKTPILASVLVNFVLFICIIRILQQKMNCPDIGHNESNQYSKLAKSTLFLIPLFGVNYIIFAFIPDHMKTALRLVFDLILGSFQGFVVAVLYCFLNGEVQAEIKRKWRRWRMQRFLGASVGSNGHVFSAQISLLTRCSPKMQCTSGCRKVSSSAPGNVGSCSS
ncbi:vasoactive intestinal polypeptide receptor-like [Arapaima gigas]